MPFQSIGFGEVYEYNNPITGPITRIVAVPPGAKWVTAQFIYDGAPSAVSVLIYQSFDGTTTNSFPVPGMATTAIAGALLTSGSPVVAPFIHMIAFSRTGGTNTKVLLTVVK